MEEMKPYNNQRARRSDRTEDRHMFYEMSDVLPSRMSNQDNNNTSAALLADDQNTDEN